MQDQTRQGRKVSCISKCCSTSSNDSAAPLLDSLSLIQLPSVQELLIAFEISSEQVSVVNQYVNIALSSFECRIYGPEGLVYLFGLAALLFVSHVDRETDLANHYHTFSLILTKCQLHLLYFEQILNKYFPICLTNIYFLH